jgi:hypothetical protein
LSQLIAQLISIMSGAVILEVTAISLRSRANFSATVSATGSRISAITTKVSEIVDASKHLSTYLSYCLGYNKLLVPISTEFHAYREYG